MWYLEKGALLSDLQRFPFTDAPPDPKAGLYGKPKPRNLRHLIQGKAGGRNSRFIHRVQKIFWTLHKVYTEDTF